MWKTRGPSRRSNIDDFPLLRIKHLNEGKLVKLLFLLAGFVMRTRFNSTKKSHADYVSVSNFTTSSKAAEIYFILSCDIFPMFLLYYNFQLKNIKLIRTIDCIQMVHIYHFTLYSIYLFDEYWSSWDFYLNLFWHLIFM